MKSWRNLFLICCGFLLSQNAQSHQISTAYLNLDSQSDLIHGEYRIMLIDLAYQLDLDVDNNQTITWGEVRAQQPVIKHWLQSNLLFKNTTHSECDRYSDLILSMDSHFNQPYLVMEFDLHCEAGKPEEINYQAMFDLNAAHKLLVNVSHHNDLINRVLSVDKQSMKLSQKANTNWQTFKEYTEQGIIHILIGLDHIMFLLCLLLFAVMLSLKPEQNSNTKTMIWHVLGLVTIFTLAHSVTLVMTALDWLSFPSRWVEIIIAITVAITALNNIWPIIRRIKWFTFVFGLMHGMGFAGVLGELGLPADAKIIPILAFNLGVELGQIMLISLMLPVLLLLARKWSRALSFFRVCSFFIMILAIYWVIERF